MNLESLYQANIKSLEESSSQFRTQRSQNPVFKPDFKSGNFFTRDDFSRKPFLLTTISDITKGMRRPAWFMSDVYSDTLSKLQNSYLTLFTSLSESPKGDNKVADTFMHNPYGFFNSFQLFSLAKTFDSDHNGGVCKEYPFLNQR